MLYAKVMLNKRRYTIAVFDMFTVILPNTFFNFFFKTTTLHVEATVNETL